VPRRVVASDRTWHCPVTKTKAEKWLVDHGSTRDGARALTAKHDGELWVIKPGKGKAKLLHPLSDASAANMDLPLGAAD
jgi:hypothetical protein